MILKIEVDTTYYILYLCQRYVYSSEIVQITHKTELKSNSKEEIKRTYEMQRTKWMINVCKKQTVYSGSQGSSKQINNLCVCILHAEQIRQYRTHTRRYQDQMKSESYNTQKAKKRKGTVYLFVVKFVHGYAKLIEMDTLPFKLRVKYIIRMIWYNVWVYYQHSTHFFVYIFFFHFC